MDMKNPENSYLDPMKELEKPLSADEVGRGVRNVNKFIGAWRRKLQAGTAGQQGEASIFDNPLRARFVVQGRTTISQPLSEPESTTAERGKSHGIAWSKYQVSEDIRLKGPGRVRNQKSTK